MSDPPVGGVAWPTPLDDGMQERWGLVNFIFFIFGVNFSNLLAC
jgi:hypothetical protein